MDDQKMGASMKEETYPKLQRQDSPALAATIWQDFNFRQFLSGRDVYATLS